MWETIYKSFAKGASVKENVGIGAIAFLGNMDRGGDCIFPGAAKDVLPPFIQNGCVLVGHAWHALEIGMPMKAAEQGNQLICEWEYHEDAEAQRYRGIAQKRLENGKTVGLSIGFRVAKDGYAWFPSGKAMWEEIQSRGDTSLFDRDSILAWEHDCRGIFKIGELFEFSQVNVPMNPKAVAASVKSLFGGDGSLADVSLADHLDAALAAAEGAAARLLGLKAMREGDDRPMSPERIAQAKRLAETLLSLDEGKADPQAADELNVDELMLKTLSLRTQLAAH